MEKSRGSGLLETPALLMHFEFPRRTHTGNLATDNGVTL